MPASPYIRYFAITAKLSKSDINYTHTNHRAFICKGSKVRFGMSVGAQLPRLDWNNIYLNNN